MKIKNSIMKRQLIGEAMSVEIWLTMEESLEICFLSFVF